MISVYLHVKQWLEENQLKLGEFCRTPYNNTISTNIPVSQFNPRG